MARSVVTPPVELRLEDVAAWFIHFPQQIADTRFGYHHGVAGKQLDIALSPLLRTFGRSTEIGFPLLRCEIPVTAPLSVSPPAA
jgi:hypothetical protein